MAYCPSAKELVVVDRQGTILLYTERDGSSSDAILGFEWTYSQELAVFCTTGVQLYQVNGLI